MAKLSFRQFKVNISFKPLYKGIFDLNSCSYNKEGNQQTIHKIIKNIESNFNDDNGNNLFNCKLSGDDDDNDNNESILEGGSMSLNMSSNDMYSGLHDFKIDGHTKKDTLTSDNIDIDKLSYNISSLVDDYSHNSLCEEKECDYNNICVKSCSQKNDNIYFNSIDIKNVNTYNELLLGIELLDTIETGDYIYVSITEIYNSKFFEKYIQDLFKLTNNIYHIDQLIIKIFKLYPYLIDHKEFIINKINIFLYEYIYRWIPCKVINITNNIELQTLPIFLFNNKSININLQPKNTYNVMNKDIKYLWNWRIKQANLYRSIGYSLEWTYHDECLFLNNLTGIYEYIINPYSKIIIDNILNRMFQLRKELPLNINLSYQSMLRSRIPQRYVEYLNKRNQYLSSHKLVLKKMDNNGHIIFYFILEGNILNQMGIDYNQWLHFNP